MIVKLIGCLSLLVYMSCKTNDCSKCDTYNKQVIDSFNNAASAFVKDIPLDKQGKPNDIYQRTREMYNTLGLPKIDTPMQNFTIRIEADFDTKNEGSEVISIAQVNGEWQGMYYRFSISATQPATIISDSLPIIPKVGWCNFMCLLISKNVIGLPYIGDTKGNEIEVTHGRYIFFEIAGKSKYRFYYYLEPTTLALKSFKEGDAIIAIMKNINENFDFHTIR